MRFFLKTYGCKVNQYESQLVREEFLSKGYLETDNIKDAQICFLNTCTVTAKADKECRQILRNIRKRNPGAKIIAAGCYAEAAPESIKAIDCSIDILGNKDKLRLNANSGIRHFSGHTRAFIKIQDGCNNFCSYCKVPLVRGSSRSRNPLEILQEARNLVDSGYKELVITGICLGDFGKYNYTETNLPAMIKKISAIEKDFRIRLSSIELPDVTDSLVKDMAVSNKLCRHLHMPLQSGDDNVLRAMNRRHTASDMISKLEYIRSIMPDIGITTDVIIGFPGETESNFDNTVKVIEQTKPSRTHIFTYSPRPGTRSYLLKDNVDAGTKKRRMARLKVVTERLAKEFRDKFLQEKQRVLIEHNKDLKAGMLCGYTDNYIKVLVCGADSLIGNFIWCKPGIQFE